jgi:hypothetical protein
MRPLEQAPAPPPTEFARTVALGVIGGKRGRYQASNHFAKQMADRGFDIFDVEYAIQNGKPTGEGEYSAEHKDHKYCFRCDIDGVAFDAVFSLSAEHDFITSPLLILITGVWKTKTGKRRKTY